MDQLTIGGRTIEGLLLDLDGVLYVGPHVIPGAVETVRKIAAAGISHRYVTNTTTAPARAIAEKLRSLGFPIREDEILTAPQAAVCYLESREYVSCRFLLNESVRQEFSAYESNGGKVDAVVVGDIGQAWTYDLLNSVFRQVMEGAELIALHRNKFWQTECGLQLDVGAFIAGLEFATGQEATIAGKPALAFFDAALQHIEVAAEKTAMIGDDIDTDVGAAQAFGLVGVQVKTGKYREDYARQSGVTPDLVLNSLAELKL